MKTIDDQELKTSEFDTRPSGEGAAWAGPSGFRLCLSVFEGPDAGRKLELRKPRVIVGRGSVDLQLSDPAVSAQHFALEVVGREVVLRDLRTPNGTRVNGEQASEATLQNLDEIQVGATSIVFIVATAEEQPETDDPAATIGAGPSGPKGGTALTPGRPEPSMATPTRTGSRPAGSTGGATPTGPASTGRSGAPAVADSAPIGTVLDGSLYRPKLGVVLKSTAIFLEVLSGPEAGRVFDLSRPQIYLIGRGSGDIVLQDSKCSQKHAQMEILCEGEYYLCDLASTNGTFVNEIRATRRKLQHMDIVRVGGTKLRFSCLEEAVPVTRK